MLTSIILEELNKHPYINVPKELMELLMSTKDIACINGCGPASGLMSGVSPSNLYGTCVSAACYIHDWRYYSGATLIDKTLADMEFLDNMITIIRNDPTSLTISEDELSLRFNEAIILFKFVHVYGFKSFALGKNISSPDTSYLHDFLHTMHITYRDRKSVV
jgi:hypothetical protein